MSRIEHTSSRASRDSAVAMFGIVALAVLAAASLVLFARLMATEMLTTGYLFLVMAVLLVLNAAHAIVQLPRRRNTTLKLACGVVAVLLALIMVWLMTATGSIQAALRNISGQTYTSDIIAVIVTSDDPAQELADTVGYTFGYAEGLDQENSDELLSHIRDSLEDIKSHSSESLTALVDDLYDDRVDAIILNKGYISLLEDSEEYADFSQQTRIIYEHEITREIQIDKPLDDITGAPFVVYCSGIDARRNNISANSNSDVNILAVVNPKTHQILLLNTPRDYYIPLHMNGRSDKLTHSGVYGIEESMGTLADLYGIEIPYYARINFYGLVDIVDALGGVDVVSPRAFTTRVMDIPDENGTLVQRSYSYPAGTVHLTGREALAFSRERYAFSDGDLQRGRNQMAVIQGIVNKITSPSILSNYQELLKAVSGSVATNITYEEITALVQMQQKNMTGWNVTSYAVSGVAAMDYCYSYSSQQLSVIRPDYETVNIAKDLIRQVMDGEAPVVPD